MTSFDAFVDEYWVTLLMLACYLAGAATVLGHRVYQDYRDGRLLAKEQQLLERRSGYDEDADVKRITGGFAAVAVAEEMGSKPVITPSPLLKEPTGGHMTVPRPDVDQRYATLQWLDTGRAPTTTVPRYSDVTLVGTHRAGQRPTVIAHARVHEAPIIEGEIVRGATQEIDFTEIWKKLNAENEAGLAAIDMENEWLRKEVSSSLVNA